MEFPIFSHTIDKISDIIVSNYRNSRIYGIRLTKFAIFLFLISEIFNFSSRYLDKIRDFFAPDQSNSRLTVTKLTIFPRDNQMKLPIVQQ